jgi:hypothetical protein
MIYGHQEQSQADKHEKHFRPIEKNIFVSELGCVHKPVRVFSSERAAQQNVTEVDKRIDEPRQRIDPEQRSLWHGREPKDNVRDRNHDVEKAFGNEFQAMRPSESVQKKGNQQSRQ